jgi:sugar lactone lactonase YvrE
MVPKLTLLRDMKITVERTQNGTIRTGTADEIFLYKTQTTVSTVVGKPEPDNNEMPTVGGDFSSATLSTPNTIVLDDEDNIFIIERMFGIPGYSSQRARNDKGEVIKSSLVLADTRSQTVTVLLHDAATESNAPTFSKEDESVYVPCDNQTGYYHLAKGTSYVPRSRSLLPPSPENGGTVFSNENYKYSFVANSSDNLVYSVMWSGALVRFNPSTRNAEVLLNNVLPNRTNVNGRNGCNVYCIFSPLEGEENLLYFCMEDYNIIGRVDVSDLADKDKTTFKGEYYAGRAIEVGPTEGKGWEDGLLKNALFNSPKQICFTADGTLYIADTGNHCIRVIDTKQGLSATVATAIGLPGNPGFRDGGPEMAQFHYPTGVAVTADGSIVYVADHKNKVIRKLSVE